MRPVKNGGPSDDEKIAQNAVKNSAKPDPNVVRKTIPAIANPTRIAARDQNDVRTETPVELTETAAKRPAQSEAPEIAISATRVAPSEALGIATRTIHGTQSVKNAAPQIMSQIAANVVIDQGNETWTLPQTIEIVMAAEVIGMVVVMIEMVGTMATGTASAVIAMDGTMATETVGAAIAMDGTMATETVGAVIAMVNATTRVAVIMTDIVTADGVAEIDTKVTDVGMIIQSTAAATMTIGAVGTPTIGTADMIGIAIVTHGTITTTCTSIFHMMPGAGGIGGTAIATLVDTGPPAIAGMIARKSFSMTDRVSQDMPLV